MVYHVELILVYSAEERRWRVDGVGDDNSGMWALNIDNNIQHEGVGWKRRRVGPSRGKQESDEDDETSEDDESTDCMDEKDDSGSLHLLVKVKQEEGGSADDESLHLLATAARVKVEDNSGEEEQKGNTQSTSARSHHTAASSKQRYIDLLKCSEHEHRGCYRLLPPSLPLQLPSLTAEVSSSEGEDSDDDSVNDSEEEDGGKANLPPVNPLPLCADCRTAIARYISRSKKSGRYGIAGITRINHSTYEIAEDDKWPKLRYFRCCIAYTPQRAVKAERKGVVQERASQKLYKISMHNYERSGLPSRILYKAECNVCSRYQNGITESGKGHSVDCHKRRKRKRRRVQ